MVADTSGKPNGGTSARQQQCHPARAGDDNATDTEHARRMSHTPHQTRTVRHSIPGSNKITRQVPKINCLPFPWSDFGWKLSYNVCKLYSKWKREICLETFCPFEVILLRRTEKVV